MQATTTFDIHGLETVEQALSLYNSIAGLQKKGWAGETNKARMAFSKFGNGLAREFKRRAQLMGCKSALDSFRGGEESPGGSKSFAAAELSKSLLQQTSC